MLRALFWQLLFRGRTAVHAAGHKKRLQLGLGWTLVLYAGLGVLPALSALTFDTLMFASTMHAFTFLFASMTLATSAGTMLFMREEAEILLHRPLRPEQLLRAKAFVLVSYALLLAGALNVAALCMGPFAKGSNWLFLPAHAFVTVLLMVFSAAAIVLVYNLCLRWFGREKLDNLLTTMQVLLTVVMVGGSQLLPQLLRTDALHQMDLSRGWLVLLPPVWFAALDVMLCGAMPLAKVWLPATMGVVVTGVVVWLAFVRLGSAYGKGLQALNEGQGVAADKVERRWLRGLVQIAPLRWWLRDSAQQQAFLLTSAYLWRDRATKLKVYPGLVIWLVMPLVMALGTGGKTVGSGVHPMDAIALSYLGMLPLQAMTLLQRSEHWRAADSFRLAPMPHWAPLMIGSSKAVLWWVAFPCTVLLGGLLAALRGSTTPLALVLVPLVMLPIYAMVPGLARCWLPLSLPHEERPSMGMGCFLMIVVLFAGMLMSGLAAGMYYLGWYWPFLVGVAALSLGLQRHFSNRMHRLPWQSNEEQ
ncbi:MAG: hypothetical protein ABIP94_19255 [Planctomycetota bacterium]